MKSSFERSDYRDHSGNILKIYSSINFPTKNINIFIHGWGASYRNWIYQEELSASMNIVLIDFPGHNGNQDWKTLEEANLSNYVSLLEEYIEKFFKNKRVNVIGHSMGGLIALLISDSLVYRRLLINPSVNSFPLPVFVKKILIKKGLLKRFFYYFFRTPFIGNIWAKLVTDSKRNRESLEIVKQGMKSVSYNAFLGFVLNPYVEDWYERLMQTQKRTRLLVSKNDRTLNSDTLRLYDTLEDTIFVKEGGHCSPLCSAEEINQNIKNFLTTE